MKIMPLIRNGDLNPVSQEALREEFEKAGRYGEIRIGENHLFYRGFLRVKFVPFTDCERIYLRVEFGEYGDLPLHEYYIVVRTKQGKEALLRLERPDDAKGVMECLKNHGCKVALGKEKTE